ncbi:MAG: chromosomal replication initiator protein DnaA [Chloroflexi bacterium]|nr:chromosomal replication initiator protein DnaA [Chloroflexota bacterium]
MAVRPARDIWTTALGSLQTEVTRNNYETWLKQTTGLEHRDGKFVIAAPNAFVATTLEQRWSPLIQKTLKGLLREDVEVAFRVAQANGTDHEAPTNGHAAATHSGNGAHTRPRIRSAQLNPRYTFDTFVVGKSNRFAHAAATQVVQNPGVAFNPLVIHAGVGLGKTHLLHAIGHGVHANGLQYLYVSAEQFTNDFVTALREGALEDFREKYRTVDVLLIDDIQFIAGKEASSESFFHTFNDLHIASKQLVITSDARPKDMPLLTDRMKSRLMAGLVADIQPPDLETRMAILGKKAEQAGVRVKQDVIDLLARRVVRNVRELEGALNRILAMSKLTNQPVDLALAEQAVADLTALAPKTRRSNPNQVLLTVATYYDLDLEDLTGKSRKKGIVLPRQVAACRRPRTNCE